MAAESWRQAAKETVISAAVILAADVFLQHVDGRLNIATDKAAVKKALHWVASRPGRFVTAAVNKAGSGSPVGIPRSLTLESEVRSLLKAHGLGSAGKMPQVPGVYGTHKPRYTFDVMLGNAERVTPRLSLPQNSQETPTSFWTYIQEAINGVKVRVCDRMISIYAILIEWGEHGFNMLSQCVLNAGLVEQVLIGSAMVIGVVVGGTYLVRAIRQLDFVFNEPEAIMPATDEESHEARLIADEHQESESGNEEDWQNATGDESGVGEIDERVVGEDEQGQSVLELKYMEALRCLMEKSSAMEALKSEAEQVVEDNEQAQSLIESKYTEALQCLMEKSSAVEALKSEVKEQKELLGTKDRQLGGLKLTQGLLDAKEDTIRTLKSSASTAEKLLGDRDKEIMRLDKANTTLESTADQQKNAITSLTTRADERMKTMKNLMKTLAEEQTESRQLRMDIANLRSDNNLIRSKNSALEADATKPLKLIAELETSNKELRKQITSLTEDYQDLQTQVDDDIVAFDNKLDDVVQLTTDKETLTAEIERLLKINEQFTELETTNGELLSEITGLIRDNEALQTQVDARGGAHEADDSDDEDEDAHDDQGPDNGGNEASRGEDHNDHEEDYDGGNDDGEEDDDQGDDAPDGGAGKTGQGGDDNQVTEQSATPTTTQEAPQQPLGADGLSGTIRSPSVSPQQAEPANSGMPATLQEVPQQPLGADGLSDTISSPSVSPLQTGPANNGKPESPPAIAAPPSPPFQQPQVPSRGPVPFTSGAPVKEGRVILPIRRRKNASDREGSQKNPFAGMTLPGMIPKLEPDVDGSTTTSPAQSLSAQDIAPQNLKQALNDDTVTSIVPPHTIYPAPGTSVVEPNVPTLPSATQDPTPAPASSPNHPLHNPSAAEDKVAPQKPKEDAKQQHTGSGELIEPKQSSPTPKATQYGSPTDELVEPERSSSTPKATQYGSSTDELIDPVQASPTPSAPEAHLASTDATQHDGPTDELIDPVQSSPVPSVSGVHDATTDSSSHGSPANGWDKPIQSPTTPSTAEQQAPRTDSGNQGASTNELIDTIQSSPVSSTSGGQAATTDAANQSSPTNEPNKSTQSSPTPSSDMVEQAARTITGHGNASTDESIGPSQSSSNTPPTSYNCPPSKTPETPAPAPSYDMPSPSHRSSHENHRPRSQSISTPSPTSPTTPTVPSHNLATAAAPLTPQPWNAVRPFSRSTSCPPSTRHPGISPSSKQPAPWMRSELEHLAPSHDEEDGSPMSLEELSAFIYTKSKAFQPSPPSNTPLPTPSASLPKSPTVNPSPNLLSATPPFSIQSRDETGLFPPAAPQPFTPGQPLSHLS